MHVFVHEPSHAFPKTCTKRRDFRSKSTELTGCWCTHLVVQVCAPVCTEGCGFVLVKTGARTARRGGSPSRLAGARRLRSCWGSARTSPPARMRGRSLQLCGKSKAASQAASPSCARWRPRGAGLTASLRRRGRPHAPAAPPVPHSISKITHTCAGKQARPPPGLRIPGEPVQRAPSSRTCRSAPPASFCAARPRPASSGPAPPQTPPLPRPRPPASPCTGGPSARRAGRLSSPRFCKFLALTERAAPVRRGPPLPPPRTISLSSSRHRRAEGCLPERLGSPSPPSPLRPSDFTRLFIICWGRGRGGERGASGGPRRLAAAASQHAAWLDEEAAQRMATRRRAPGSRAWRDDDIICLYASN